MPHVHCSCLVGNTYRSEAVLSDKSHSSRRLWTKACELDILISGTVRESHSAVRSKEDNSSDLPTA